MSTPESAGWFDDPEDDSQLRYFDGIIWSDRTAPRHAPRRQRPTPEDPAAQEGPGTDVFGRPAAGGQQPHAQPHERQSQQPWAGQQPQHGQHPHAGQQPPAGWGAPQQAGWPQPGVTPEATTADGQPLASYASRAGAYLIDLLIVWVLNLLFAGWAWWLFIADYWAYALDLTTSNPGTTQMPSMDQVASLLNYQYFFIALGITVLVEGVYHVGFLAARNATPGKQMLGISVRRVDVPGRLGVGVSFMRALLPLGLRVLWAFTCLFDGIVRAVDLLWPLKDQRQQALHDKIAGTQVVKGKQPRDKVSQES